MAPTRPYKVTQTDKLHAMNNLQSEITRRARSLRSEYARVAQGLRSKLEMRIYRIPKALRNANMGELLQKYIDAQEQEGGRAQKSKASSKERAKSPPKQSPAVARKTQTVAAKAKAQAQAQAQAIEAAVKPKAAPKATQTARTRGTKRTSDIMIAADNNGTDKENEEALENPKKRAKDNTNQPSRPLRDPGAILSPKSNNSRTLPRSPTKPVFGASTKGFTSRPASPLKPSVVSRIPPASPVRQPARPATAASTAGATRSATARATKATTASTRAANTRTTTAKGMTRSASNSTNDSTATSATTIVRRGAVSRAGGMTASAAAKKTTATGSTAASARRTAATKGKPDAKADVSAAPSTRRVLRKRA